MYTAVAFSFLSFFDNCKYHTHFDFLSTGHKCRVIILPFLFLPNYTIHIQIHTQEPHGTFDIKKERGKVLP